MPTVSRRPHGRGAPRTRPSLDDAAKLHTSLAGAELTECPRCGRRTTPPDKNAGVTVFVCPSCGFKMVVDRTLDRSAAD